LQPEVTKEEFESLKTQLEKLKEKGIPTKEIIKEVKQITQIQPVIETTKKVIDSKSLADLTSRLSKVEEWESDIKTLQALTQKLKAQPAYTSAPTAPVYIGSQGLQVGGAVTLASLGVSGSAGITNLGVGGSATIGSDSTDNFTVNATANFLSPAIFREGITVGTRSLAVDSSGNLETPGTLTAGTSILSALTTTGNLTVGGNLAVLGSQTYSGIASFTASSTSAVLSVNQTGTGDIINFKDSGTTVVAILEGGKVGIGTTTPASLLTVGSGGEFQVNSSGQVVAGTWQGTEIGTQYGGTGQDWSSVAIGSIPYFSATGTLSTLSPGTSGYFLKTQGVGQPPTWAEVIQVWSDSGTALYPTNLSRKVGVGTSSPSYTFEVVGTGGFTTSSSATALTVAQSGNGNIVEFKNATTTVFTVADDGNVTLTGNLLPSSGNQAIGSVTAPWKYGYFDEISANNIVAGGTEIAGTKSETFTINSDATTSEDVYLRFKYNDNRYAVMFFDQSEKQFDYDYPFYFSTTTAYIKGAGQINITASSPSTWQVSGGNLTIKTDASGDILLSSAGNLTQRFATTSAFTLYQGPTARLAIDTSGNISLTATSTIFLAGNTTITGNATTTGSQIVGGTLTVSGTATSTFAGPLQITSTFQPQLSVRYDSSNKLDVSVSSVGAQNQLVGVIGSV